MQDLTERGEESPLLTLSIMGVIVLVFLVVAYRIIFGGKKAKASKKVMKALCDLIIL